MIPFWFLKVNIFDTFIAHSVHTAVQWLFNSQRHIAVYCIVNICNDYSITKRVSTLDIGLIFITRKSKICNLWNVIQWMTILINKNFSEGSLELPQRSLWWALEPQFGKICGTVRSQASKRQVEAIQRASSRGQLNLQLHQPNPLTSQTDFYATRRHCVLSYGQGQTERCLGNGSILLKEEAVWRP